MLLLIGILAFLVAIFLLSRRLDIGLLLLVFLFPYLGLEIDFGKFEQLREAPYLKDINAPLVDLYGLLLLVAWWIAAALPSTGSPSAWQRISMPHWKSYALFWLSGLVSLLRVPSWQLGASLKYLARPFTFAYLVFFAMPVSILSRIRNQESGIRVLNRVLLVFFWTGLLSAFNGLLGLLFGAHPDFPRAMPFGFFGMSPLGENHNLLAETLIATAPVGLILKGKWVKRGMFFQWAIALLTFARTAWIAVAVQAGIWFWFNRGKLRIKKLIWPMISLIILLIFLFVSFSTESVIGSTLSRLEQARVAVFYFLRSPWIGQGIGTYIPTLWQTKAFLLEFGSAMEAHGIVWKLLFEQGLFGLIAFGVFVGAVLRTIYRTKFAPALMIAAGSLVYQLFNTTYYTSKLWIPLAIALVISKAYEYSNHHSKMVS